MKLIFFSDSYLAPKFFEVVANSNKLVAIFQDKQTFFFMLGRPYKIKLEERSFTCYKVDTRMDDIQRSNSPKSMMASSYRQKNILLMVLVSVLVDVPYWHYYEDAMQLIQVHYIGSTISVALLRDGGKYYKKCKLFDSYMKTKTWPSLKFTWKNELTNTLQTVKYWIINNQIID